MTRRIQNPVDLMLRIARTPDGLRITSPQIPNFAAIARGPVPIAQAVDAALTQLDCDTYARRRGKTSDLAQWDAAAESLAASGAVLSADDVIVVRHGPSQRRSSGALMRPTATNGARHDPMSWTDLGNGVWQSPTGRRYPESTRCVQRVIAQRTGQHDTAGAATPSLFDQATG